MKYVAIGIFILGIGSLIHQNFTTVGGWFCWEQFIGDLHHETLAVLCFVSSISLLIGRYMRSRSK